MKPITGTPGPLQVESLEVTLKSVTFDAKNLVLWPRYWKYPAEYQDLLILISKLGVTIP